MLPGLIRIIEAMITVGVRHELKLFVVFYKLIDQHFCILVMHIVVSCSVDV